MSISYERQQEIVNFLASLPNMHNQSGRQAVVYGAGLGPEVERELDFSGPTAVFCQSLVRKLAPYNRLPDGRHALAAVLDAAKEKIGEPGRSRCIGWIQELNSAQEEEHGPSPLRQNLKYVKKQQLEKRLTMLHEQYKAANAQLLTALSAVDKVTLQRHIDQIEEDIQEVEAKLTSL